jgi:hypothetical protein
MNLAADEKSEIVTQAVKQGLQGGLLTAAASIVSGVGIGSVTTITPITILWGLLTIGTTTVTTPVWLPAVIGSAAAGGAILAGTAGATVCYSRIKQFNADGQAACGGPES